MKFCSYCGFELQDDMSFCPKCGKESVLKTNAISSSMSRLQEIKNMQVVLDPSVITWDYVHTLNGTEAANFVLKQNELSTNIGEKIKGLLSEINEDERDIVERECYAFALNTCVNLCESCSKMFQNYSGLQELFNQLNQQATSFIISPAQVLNTVMQEDYIYKSFALVQTFSVGSIMDALDENIIKNNNEYRLIEKKIAETFNSMMGAIGKRHIDFFHSTGEEFINGNWEIYCKVTKGLLYDELDSIPISGWMVCLNDMEKNHNAGAFKTDFVEKVYTHIKRRKDIDEAYYKSLYFSKYPNEQEKFDKLKADANEQGKIVSAIEDEYNTLNNTSANLNRNISDYKLKVAEKQRQIDKEQKRFFGKDKAQAKIVELKDEIAEINEKLARDEIQLNTNDELLVQKQKELGAQRELLTEKIGEIERFEKKASEEMMPK